MARWLAVLGLIAAALTVVPQADAIELGLAGVTLGQRALDLLDLKPYGPPPFIGPLGAVTTWGIAPLGAPGAGPGAAPGAGYGPTGSAPSVYGAPGYAAGPAPTRTARPPGLRLSFGRRTTTRTTAAAPRGGRGPARPLAAATTGLGGGIIYWLYNMPGGARVVLGIEASGKVRSIVLSGQSYPAAKTEGGVRLGDSYTSVLDKYGFPDTTHNLGGSLVLGYGKAGLTLTLNKMRVQTIALAKPGAAGAMASGGAKVPVAPARRVGLRTTAPLPRVAPGTTPGRTTGRRTGFRLSFGRRRSQSRTGQ